MMSISASGRMEGMAGLSFALAVLASGACAGDEPEIYRIPLIGDRVFPEGIAAHGGSGEIFVSGLADGEIQRIRDGEASPFKASHADGLKNAIGMAVDPVRDRLWVASTGFLSDGEIVISPDDLPEVLVFDSGSGVLLGRFAVPHDGSPHFLNDIAVDGEGNAYITDSLAPTIWTIDAGLSGIEKFVEDPALVIQEGFNLNGIAITPDQRYVMATIPGAPGALFRISLDGREITEVAFDRPFRGADGLVFVDPERLIGVVGGLFLIELSDDYARGRTVDLPDFESMFDFATTADVLDDRLYVVNSQLDHIVPMFENDAPPEVPFTITSVPLELILTGSGG